ncbi:lipid A deacylase LpxR family protein [Pyruvatibacter mobilis]|uniref:lipid A deacylase LpxR family protein n=1 Tax=Pyruvatibacter mobilis TaxID=1712261 RepID=UPI003C7CDDFA
MTCLSLFRAGSGAAVLSLLGAFGLAGASPALAAGCGSQERHRIAAVQAENDLFGNGADRHYTHGTQATFISGGPVPQILQDIGHGTPGFGRSDRMQFSVSVGQSIFTPDDISIPTLQKDDRPYAGWLNLGLGVVAFHQDCAPDGTSTTTRIDALEVAIGVIGPWSQADDVQTTWHDWIDTKEPRGWANQLENEPGIVLTYERRLPRRLDIQWFEDALPFNLEADATPHFGFSLGNVFTHAAAGATLRIGDDLSTTDGVPRIRPSLPGSGYFEPVDGITWQAFGGAELRAVARNIFLDGNTFQNSHRVEKETLVADFQAGVALTIGRARVTFTNIWRSKEFKKQDAWDEFGSISAAFHF